MIKLGEKTSEEGGNGEEQRKDDEEWLVWNQNSEKRMKRERERRK